MKKTCVTLLLATVVLSGHAQAPDLTGAFDNLKNSVSLSEHDQDLEVDSSLKALADSGISIPDNEVYVVVDRNPARQLLTIVKHVSGDSYEVIGSTRVSTGKPGRKEHFTTPVGVFDYNGDILGYRAEGTYNGNHIRGLGTKGHRVWDFG